VVLPAPPPSLPPPPKKPARMLSNGLAEYSSQQVDFPLAKIVGASVGTTVPPAGTHHGVTSVRHVVASHQAIPALARITVGERPA
jgi:hypothetical protein